MDILNPQLLNIHGRIYCKYNNAGDQSMGNLEDNYGVDEHVVTNVCWDDPCDSRDNDIAQTADGRFVRSTVLTFNSLELSKNLKTVLNVNLLFFLCLSVGLFFIYNIRLRIAYVYNISQGWAKSTYGPPFWPPGLHMVACGLGNFLCVLVLVVDKFSVSLSPDFDSLSCEKQLHNISLVSYVMCIILFYLVYYINWLYYFFILIWWIIINVITNKS